MRKTAKLLLIAVAFTLAITACNDEDPERILWEVAAAPSENVEAFASPDFHPSILINAKRQTPTASPTPTAASPWQEYRQMNSR